MKQAQVQGLKLFLFLALALVLNIFLVKKEHEASTRNVFELFFLSKLSFQVRSWFCQDGRCRSKFKESILETVQRSPGIYGKCCKDFKDRNKQSHACGKIASTMTMKMVKIHSFNFLLL